MQHFIMLFRTLFSLFNAKKPAFTLESKLLHPQIDYKPQLP